jgi:hypothetical protein
LAETLERLVTIQDASAMRLASEKGKAVAATVGILAFETEDS